MERAVVERARKGDREAFSELAGLSIDRLYRVGHRIVRDPEMARDATQQALLEAWRDLPSLRDPDRWEAWTYRLLVRACYREIRRTRRVAGDVRLIPMDRDIAIDTEASVADRDELDRAFGRLPADQRAVVVLHHYVGLPLTEVATTLGIPAGTARSRLHTATRRLRAAIEADSLVPTGNDQAARKGHAV
ncbi:MAG TPA: RNA polymerase sigma factor [Candidatus Limnocylindrales bacterium]|nr:RNA polymerase sigma factor [Candidatus Limnocylindrales bacterium]